MTNPAPGMDQDHYRYDPLPWRPTLRWPDNSPLAVSVVLYVEYWSVEAGDGRVRDPRYSRRGTPDFLHHSWFEYGNRIGIFRLLDALKSFGFKISAPMNAMAAERYPALVRSLLDDGVEVVGHGLSATEMQSSRMTPESEAAFIETSLRRLQAAIGHRPSGWISQDYGQSTRTPGLLAEAGLTYVSDWANDDQPYWMSDGTVSVPSHPLWNDLHTIWDRNIPVRRYPELLVSGATRLHQEGKDSGRMLSIGLHPWIMGASHRIKYLEQTLAKIAVLPDLWHATLGEVAAHFATVSPRSSQP